MLSSLSQLLIGADYGNADRSFLDNVRLVPPGGDNLRSEFDASAEGWVVAQLDDSTWMPCTFQGPMWNAAGGSGGGCIEHFDLCNLPCGGTAHFAAPRRFLGDKSAFAGGLVRWDLRDPTEGGGASSWGLILIGGGMAIRGAAGRPSAAWSSFGVRLEAESFEHPDARVVTAPEFAAVLSSLEFVLVSADWGSHANNPSLDNFCFVPPLPLSGDGCPAVAGPRIEYFRVSPHPGIGSTPVIELSNLPLDAFFAATLIGLQPIDVPIDPGNAPGCSLLVGSVMDTVAMSLTPPNAALPLPIPDDTRYVGASVLLQGAALARSANALGVVVSQRATMTIGR